MEASVTTLVPIANGNIKAALSDGTSRTLARDTLKVVVGKPLTHSQWWDAYTLFVGMAGRSISSMAMDRLRAAQPEPDCELDDDGLPLPTEAERAQDWADIRKAEAAAIESGSGL